MSKRKRYGAEEIIAKLREAEVHLAQGQTVGQAVRRLGVSEQINLCQGASLASAVATRPQPPRHHSE
jgi:hypothetical protein